MDNLWIIYGKSMHNLWINKKNLMKYIVCFKYIYICYKYFNEAAHLLSAEFMQTGSVWGFLPWYRFKQTISFSGSGLFFDIFALLALIFFKDTKNLSSIYITCWYLHNSNTIGSNVFQLNLLFFSKLKYNNLIVKIIIRHVYRDCVLFYFTLSVFFLILLLAYFLQEWYIYFCDIFFAVYVVIHSSKSILQ